jgi:hypothetical protein
MTNDNIPIKIISGGQTGADRAALDVALALKLPCGGYCPAGRWAEDGEIDEIYPLEETEGHHPAERTGLNVSLAGGVLVLTSGLPDTGTKLTLELAKRSDLPCLHMDFDDEIDPDQVLDWMAEHNIRNLNVAGPRESNNPGLYTLAKGFLMMALRKNAR